MMSINTALMLSVIVLNSAACSKAEAEKISR